MTFTIVIDCTVELAWCCPGHPMVNFIKSVSEEEAEDVSVLLMSKESKDNFTLTYKRRPF